MKGPSMTLALGLVVITAAIYAIYRRVDVRLALLLAALALGSLAGNPAAIVRTFLETFSDEKYVVPICTAMGFAYVLRHTGCDQHLVHLLVGPLRRVRPLLIPGTVAIGFFVNIPVISQTSSAVALGTLVVPLLLGARLSPVTVGATLLLGCSIGGELLNPGAPELQTVATVSAKTAKELKLPSPEVTPRRCVDHVLPLSLISLAAATAVFWPLCIRAEKRRRKQEGPSDPQVGGVTTDPAGPSEASFQPFQVNPVKALIPLVPLVLLFVAGPPLSLVKVPQEWLVQRQQGHTGLYDSRLIGAAMLVGVLAAALVAWRSGWRVATVFFEGAGYGFTHIISLIVAANCFGQGIRQIGLADLVGDFIRANPSLLLPAAAVLPCGFAVLCGSGMASTQSTFGFLVGPALSVGIDPAHVGAVVSLAAAAGRTMSPVAAVTLMCAAMTNTSPLDLIRRVALPLLVSLLAVVIAAMLMAGYPQTP
jgi:DcuC family C4-dicarboxylate transporter